MCVYVCVYVCVFLTRVSYFSQKYSLLDTVFWKSSSTLLFPNLSQYNVFIHIQNQISYSLCLSMGFPGGSDCKESACNAGDPSSIPGEEDTLEKEMATHSRILAWISWQRSLKGFSPWGCKESDGTEGLTFTFHVSVYLDTYNEMSNAMCCKLILS